MEDHMARKPKPNEVTKDWLTLCQWLAHGDVTEGMLQQMLDLEMSRERPRTAFISRIFTRMARLRNTRELEELLSKAR